MTQKAWMRFTGPTLNLMGRVDVPARCPTWFKETLSGLAENRLVTMDEVKPSLWLDSLISTGHPIYLYKPLLMQSTVEKIYVIKSEIEKAVVTKDGKRVVDPALASKCLTKTYTAAEVEDLVQKGTLDVKDLTAITPSVIGMQNNEIQVPLPVLDYTVDNVDTYRVLSSSFTMYVEVKNFEYFENMAEEVYAPQVEAVRTPVLAGPGFSG